MTALNPEIIKDTKNLISLYQKNSRFRLAFDKIVANNINATYHGRPVKLYVEVLKNVTSKYKQEYSQIRKIVHDTEGKVGKLFDKVDPKNDFDRLDEAYYAALKGKNILDNEKNIKKEEIQEINETIEEINKTEEKFKNNKGFIDNKGKREEYQTKIEAGLLLKEDPEEQESTEKKTEAKTEAKTEPENEKLTQRTISEEKARVEGVLNQSDEKITETETPLRGPSNEPIRNIRPKPSQEIFEIQSEAQSGFQQEPSKSSLPSISNIPRPSGFRQFISNPKASVSNIFNGGARASRVVATEAGKAIGKISLNTALKTGARAAAKLGASALLGAATGGVGLVVMLATSFGGNFKDIIKWVIIILFAIILLFFVFQRGMKMNSLLPPYDVPTMGSVGPISTSSGELDKRCNFSAFDIFNANSVSDDLLKKYTDRALASGKVKTSEQKDNLASRAKYIRDQAQSAGLNPAIFLGYWESESAFSNYSYPGVRPGMDLGCDPTNRALNGFEANVLCAIGKSSISNSRTSQCALSKNINSDACKAISFQQAEGVKLPISTLKDFLDSYGSKIADPNNTTSDNIVKQNIVDLGLVQCLSTPPITPYMPPSGCIAARGATPPLNEYDYPRSANYQGKVWPMTCGPTSGAMVLQSTGINASIADVTNQWEADGAWSGSVGFYASAIPNSINKRYPDSLRAEYKTIKTVNQLRSFLRDSQNPIMISVYYENNATGLGLDKIQTAGAKGNTPGGIAITKSDDPEHIIPGHMIVVYQSCDDRVYINDPIFGEQYSVPNSQFNQAISFDSRGEAVVVYSKR